MAVVVIAVGKRHGKVFFQQGFPGPVKFASPKYTCAGPGYHMSSRFLFLPAGPCIFSDSAARCCSCLYIPVLPPAARKPFWRYGAACANVSCRPRATPG